MWRPRDEETEVGPCINVEAAERVGRWVQESVGAGATVHTGGSRDGASYAPTVLTGVPADARVAREEVFGPVLLVERVSSIGEGFARINDSDYGLQAGVFTRDIATALSGLAL